MVVHGRADAEGIAAGVIIQGDIDREPSNEERIANAEDREAFVEGLMINLLGKQQAKGAS